MNAADNLNAALVLHTSPPFDGRVAFGSEGSELPFSVWPDVAAKPT